MSRTNLFVMPPSSCFALDCSTELLPLGCGRLPLTIKGTTALAIYGRARLWLPSRRNPGTQNSEGHEELWLYQRQMAGSLIMNPLQNQRKKSGSSLNSAYQGCAE